MFGVPGAFGKLYPKQRLKCRDSFKLRTAVADTRHRVKRRPMRCDVTARSIEISMIFWVRFAKWSIGRPDLR